MRPPVSRMIAPRKIDRVPRVMTMEWTFPSTDSAPFPAPRAAPTPSAAAAIAHAGHPAASASPAAVAASPRMAPTEMSIPPAMITIVMPRAPTRRIALLSITSRRFDQVAKLRDRRREDEREAHDEGGQARLAPTRPALRQSPPPRDSLPPDGRAGGLVCGLALGKRQAQQLLFGRGPARRAPPPGAPVA